MKKLAVYMGRFQPFHNGHMSVVNHIAVNYDCALFLIGSANVARSVKNPFNSNLVSDWVDNAVLSALQQTSTPFCWKIAGINDYYHDESAWENEVNTTVSDFIKTLPYPVTIHLVGGAKEDTTSYLHGLKERSGIYESVSLIDTADNPSGTEVRERLFNRLPFDGKVPEYVNNFLQLWMNQEPDSNLSSSLSYEYFVEENKHILKEKEKVYPSEPKAVTASALFMQMDENKVTHILLIKRKDFPGKDLWAMPGKEVNENENVIAAATDILLESISLNSTDEYIPHVVTSKLYESPMSNYGPPKANCVVEFIQTLKKSNLTLKGVDNQEVQFVPVENLSALPMFSDHKELVQLYIKRYNG